MEGSEGGQAKDCADHFTVAGGIFGVGVWCRVFGAGTIFASREWRTVDNCNNEGVESIVGTFDVGLHGHPYFAKVEPLFSDKGYVVEVEVAIQLGLVGSGGLLCECAVF